MKHIIFSIAVLCAVAAQAAYYKYEWQPTTGGEFSTVDDVNGWKKSQECSSYNQYYLQKTQSAALTLANDWTMPGVLYIKEKSNAFDFASSTLTVDSGFYFQDGGSMIIQSGTFVSKCSKKSYVGYRGTGNQLIVTGKDSKFVQSSGTVNIGWTPSGSYPYGTNTLLVTDHAQMDVYSAYVGSNSGGNPGAGLENRLEVSDGATLDVTGLLHVCPGGTVRVKDATVNFNGVPRLYKGTRCAFENSTVAFAKSSDLGSFGDTPAADYTDAELCFTNSTVTVTKRIRFINSTNLVLRLINSTMTCDEGLLTAYTGMTVSPGNTIVFGGAEPKLTLTEYGWYPNAKLRFEISEAGFPTDRPIMTATNTSKGFNLMGATDGTRTVEIAIDPKCPSGTYTLLKGKNATHSNLTINLDYDPDKTKAKIAPTTIDGVEALQVKV